MDNKALYNLSYGVFVLGSKMGGKINACITNTCMQVASEPLRVAISVLNQNYTCEMIKQSGVFALSILDVNTPFELIKRFGYQSGRSADKFAGFEFETDKNGCPYVRANACALLSCKVLSATDLGTHTLFVAEIEDAKVLNSNPPMTYAHYQSNVKPKTKIESNKKIIGWHCKICGYEYEGAQLPSDFKCPLCGHPVDDFEPIYEG